MAVGAGLTILVERGHVPAPAPPVPVLELVGNDTFTTAEIRAAIAPVETPFVDERGVLDEDAVAREVLLVESFYWDHGHADVHADTRRADRAAIVIHVDEGPRFTISSVKVAGELLGTEASHLAMMTVRAGVMFSRTMIATDRETLQTFYADRSYAFATVLPRTEVDRDHRTVALVYDIERGPASTFERIEVEARTPAREDVIRRVMPIAAGQPFSETALVETRRRALGLGMFRGIALSIRRGSGDDRVIAKIEETD